MSKISNILGFVKSHAKTIGIVASSATAFAATAVSVNKAVVKVDEVKKEYEDHINDVETVLADENIPESKYSQEDAENDIQIITTQRIVKSVTAFLPTAVLVGISAAATCAFKSPFVIISSILGGSIGFAYTLKTN